MNSSLKRLSEIEIKVPKLVNTPKQNLASEFYKRIIQMIHEFDTTLDITQEVGMRLVSFGHTITFNINHVGYSDPSLIIFSGCLEDGSPVNLVQHVSQINFLLMSVKRQNPEQPKIPIGFINHYND